jgi:hypothetical protein
MQDVSQVLDELLDTPSEAVHALAAVRKFFNWARQRRLVDRSPCEGLQLGVRSQSRTRVLSDAELVKVYRGAEQIEYPYGNLAANLDADADLAIVIPTYVFARKVLGGQLSVGMIGAAGRNDVSVDATLTGQLGPLGFSISRGRSDETTGFGDLVPLASLRWNQGVHNYMTYITGDIPVGAYDPTRLANIGIGHGAVDAGFGYTYFDPKTGNEFSAVLGFTYNLENQQTDYKNGVDMHLDWGASKFLTKQLQVGLVGYFYEQISPDSGSGDRVGSFESRVIGIGPQLGFIFPVGDMQGYLNLKGYKEFAAEHRPDGWNTWLTFVLSPAPPKAVERSMK